MTVTNPVNKNIFSGDGITTVFSYTFQLPASSNGSDIYLFVFDNLGVMTPITSNFTLDLNAATITYPVTPGIAPLAPAVAALPANWQIVAMRIESLTQALNMVTQGPFPAAGIMAAFDMLTFICQQLQEQINRATLVAVNVPGPATPVVAPTVYPVGLVQVNGTWAQLVTLSVANPTVQFLGFVTSGDMAGQWFFYTGNVLLGNQGFLGIGG